MLLSVLFFSFNYRSRFSSHFHSSVDLQGNLSFYLRNFLSPLITFSLFSFPTRPFRGTTSLSWCTSHSHSLILVIFLRLYRIHIKRFLCTLTHFLTSLSILPHFLLEATFLSWLPLILTHLSIPHSLIPHSPSFFTWGEHSRVAWRRRFHCT